MSKEDKEFAALEKEVDREHEQRNSKSYEQKMKDLNDPKFIESQKELDREMHPEKYKDQSKAPSMSEKEKQHREDKDLEKQVNALPDKPNWFKRALNAVINWVKSIFSGSKKEQTTESANVAPSGVAKTKDHSPAKSEDLSKAKEALKNDTKTLESLKHKITGQPLTDKDRTKFTQDMKAINAMTKDQLSAKSQEVVGGIEKANRTIEGLTKVKHVQETAKNNTNKCTKNNTHSESSNC